MSKRAAFTAFAAAMTLVALGGGVGRASVGHLASGAGCSLPPPIPLPPASEFVSQVDNPYFPLLPGTTYFYRGSEDGDAVQDKVIVTDSTKTILGVQATVVLDLVNLNGQPAEKTFDWYAQDRHGNVWYLGEDAFDRVNGQWVRAGDSWRAGRYGALAGQIMEADPAIGDTYRQEFSAGNAEDAARVSSTDASIRVPYGEFHHALKTAECTPIEPGAIDQKYYGRGIGEVSEATVQGGSAQLDLVSVTH